MMPRLLIIALIVPLAFCGCVQEKTGEIYVFSGKALKNQLAEISKDFSDEYGIKVNITFASYSKMVEVIKATKHVDVVIAPERFGLFNVSTIVALEKLGLVKDRKPFVKRIPVIVVRNDSSISSLQDLNGKTIVLVNQSKYHSPGGCLGIEIVKAENINATIIYAPPKNLIEFVKTGKADATIVWLDTVIDKVDGLRTIPIGKYEMQLYIATLNENKAVESYVSYLISHKGYFEKRGWGS
jgi:molybdate transport system substrate-binding protein